MRPKTVTVKTKSSINLFSAAIILTAMLALLKVTGLFPALTLFQILLPVIVAFGVWLLLIVLAILIFILASLAAIIAAVLK